MFVWSCNNGPSQAFDMDPGADCAAAAGTPNAVIEFSQTAPFDSSCFTG
jgi:hypothetical protein